MISFEDIKSVQDPILAGWGIPQIKSPDRRSNQGNN